MADLRALPLLAALTVMTAAQTASASFPAGVWGLVDKVTLSPDANNPSVVRIDGLFIVANQLPDFPGYPGYGEPQAGYMYYSCTEKQLATCAMEWKELLAVAGTEDNCRGWGDKSFPNNGSVRPAVQQPQGPDLYPISMGVLNGFTPCEALKAWQLENPDTTGGDTTGTSGESGTTAGDTGTTAGDTGGTVGDTGGTAGDAGGTVGDTGGTVGDAGGTVGDAGGTAGDATGDATGKLTGDPLTEGGGSGGDAGTASAEGSSSGGETAADEADDKGCACDSAGEPRRQLPAALLTLLGLGLLRRRKS